jgi:hypothetical protein
MDEKYHIADFGEFEFILRKKGTKNWFRIFATITDIDKYYILISDNSGSEYLVQKRDIKRFDKQILENKFAHEINSL